MPEALSKYADVKFYGAGYGWRHGEVIDILELIKKLYIDDYPDVIIQDSPSMGGLFNILRNFERARCLRVMWLVDFHNDVGSRFWDTKCYDYIKGGNIDLVLKPADIGNVTEWGEKILRTEVPIDWYPFSIDPRFFYDRNIPKIYDVCNIGTMNTQGYPIRYRFHQLLKGRSDIIYFRPAQFIKGEDYPIAINQSRIFATDTGSVRFPVQKMFEVMACNTLLLSNSPLEADAKALGFKPGVNFAGIDDYPKAVEEVQDDKIMEPLLHYLSHPDEAAQISKRGHDLVHSRHTHDIRAKEIIQMISKYI